MPTALSHETIKPDHVVLSREDDGTYRLLLYVGKHGSGFIFLREVVLSAEHAAGLMVGHLLEDVQLELDEPGSSLADCACGAPLMPSGWCSSGHAPGH